MVRRGREKPWPLFFHQLDTVSRRNPTILPFFCLPKGLCHRSAFEDRRQPDNIFDPPTESQSTDFLPPGRHWCLLSSAAFHREYDRCTVGRLSLCFQSVARRACDASC